MLQFFVTSGSHSPSFQHQCCSWNTVHPPHHHLNLKLVRMTSITITPTPAEREGREDELEEGQMLRVRGDCTCSGNNNGCANEYCSDGDCSTHSISSIVPKQLTGTKHTEHRIILEADTFCCFDQLASHKLMPCRV